MAYSQVLFFSLGASSASPSPCTFLSQLFPAAAVTAKANAAALKLTTAAAASGYASFSTALVSNSTGVMAPLAANGVMGLAWVDTVLGLQAQKLLVSVDAGAAALP